jgi:hypothetical protein
MFCIKARLCRLRKDSLLDRPGLSSNCASPGLSVRGSRFSNPREYFSFQTQGCLAAASISPGENGPELSNQPLRLFLATRYHVLYQGTTLRVCGKTHVLYQGTTLVGP